MLRRRSLLWLLPLLLLIAATPIESRLIFDLDQGWRFQLTGEDAAAACTTKEAVCHPSFEDSAWRTVDLPHDFIVEGTFDATADKAHGYLPYAKGYYRRSFFIPSEWMERRIWIDFEGVQRNSTIYVNGERLQSHASGYTPFRFVLTNLHYGLDQTNVLVVHIDATKPDGWWYDGGGIYRHVYLTATDLLHIIPWGVYLYSQVKESSIRRLTANDYLFNEEKEASIHRLLAEADKENNKNILVGYAKLTTQVAVESERKGDTTFALRSTLQGPFGENKHVIQSSPHTLEAGTSAVISLVFDLPSAALWSLDHPALYRVKNELLLVGGDGVVGSEVIDAVKETTGIRTIAFDANTGFYLNGESIKIQGMCNHQDYAGLGVAVPDSMQPYRVRKMKEMGANAWRTAHNPPSIALLDETDRQGMLVWDENHRNIAEGGEWLDDLQSLILRDRNHPSIIIWSVCNERLCEEFNATSCVILRDMMKNLDPKAGRVVSAAVNEEFYKDFGSKLDLMGINYNIKRYDSWHYEHPEQPLIGSETSSAVSDRGIYANDASKAYVSSYDVNAPAWGASAEDAWCAIVTKPWMAGSFLWTGFDYKGEPTPYEWPNINSHFGVIDIAGFEKDLFYYYQSVWSTQPMVHLVPQRWNWEDDEDDVKECEGHCRRRRFRGGIEIEVWTYSNGDEVELFLNGRSLGRQAVPEEEKEGARCRHNTWKVIYEAGTLVAQSYDKRGNLVATDVIKTTGEPTQIGIVLDWPSPPSAALVDGDVGLLDIRLLDKDGNIVTIPRYNNKHISFHLLSGPGRILGVGNGDPSSHEADCFPATARQAQRSAFNGHARVIVQAMRRSSAYHEEDKIVVEASSPGLMSSSISIPVLSNAASVSSSFRVLHSRGEVGLKKLEFPPHS